MKRPATASVSVAPLNYYLVSLLLIDHKYFWSTTCRSALTDSEFRVNLSNQDTTDNDLLYDQLSGALL